MEAPKKSFPTRYALVAVIVVAILLVAGVSVYYYLYSTPSKSGSTLKIAFLSNGPASTSWNQAHIKGLEQVISDFNSTHSITLSMTLNQAYDPTSQGNDISSYESLGYNLIIEMSGVFPNVILQHAGKNTNIQYMEYDLPTANLTSNTATFTEVPWEGMYPACALGALMSKTGIIGSVQAIPGFLEGAQAYNACVQGAHSVKPNTSVIFDFTQNFNDPVKGGQAAQAMISKGADIIWGFGDGMTDGAIKQAAQDGLYSIGYLSDESSLAPNYVLTSTLWNTTMYYYTALSSIFTNGNLGGQVYNYGFAQHVTSMVTPPSWVPANITSKFQTILSQLESGQITVQSVTTFPTS